MASRKRQIFEELIYEVRRSQNATDRFDQAVAETIGINRTDLRCLDVIQREWPVAAGRLAEQTGLTTGAIYATGWSISVLAVLGAIFAVWIFGI